MTRTLKCTKCKKPIKEDEKAYRCSDCETYPFHVDCLDDDGCCAGCAKDRERKDEDEEVEIEVSTASGEYILDGEFTRKEAEALIAEVGKAIELGKPAMMAPGNPDHYFVLRNITEIYIKS